MLLTRFLATLLAFIALASPACAADWWRAETDHFIVYSLSTQEETEELAVKLERFDEALRFLQNMSPSPAAQLADSAKLTLYQFGSPDDIGYLAAGRPSDVAGFFIPRAGNSVAFIPRRKASIGEAGGSVYKDNASSLDPQIVLFHEYSHYFMYQHAPAAYPAWYREGSAEVYGTLQLLADGFRLGEPALHRSFALNYYSNYSVKKLLDPPEELTDEDGIQLYSLGWLLCHYLTFSNERPGQLGKYLTLVNQGETSLAAAQQAFGDLAKLEKDLDKYRGQKTPVIDVHHADYRPPLASSRKLGADEAAMMDLHIKTTRGVEEKKAAGLLGTARSLVSRYPDSVPVLSAAMEAEFDAKEDDRAEALARHILELDGTNAAAHLFLGHIWMGRAEKDPAQFASARREYVAANRLGTSDPRPLLGYYRSFSEAGAAAPESARAGLEEAFESARFDNELRTTLADLYLIEERNQDAIALLGPIANDPHGGKTGKRIRETIGLITAGKITEAREKLAAKDEDDEEERGSR